jgi:hypothetical protein
VATTKAGSEAGSDAGSEADAGRRTGAPVEAGAPPEPVDR